MYFLIYIYAPIHQDNLNVLWKRYLAVNVIMILNMMYMAACVGCCSDCSCDTIYGI